ncbi:hypothetical protein DSM104299_05763 [Baekduia alba]|uniref:Ig-like domain-containing protein n=1 Tax=Baekduia alba TaxID=2997333 RepID=UPI0023409C1A|nr:Ig-like domain-containing protein [Baekduia alba]WCB96993.1 hypothetical protein DSM104299_05763 [Baekduia alba]
MRRLSHLPLLAVSAAALALPAAASAATAPTDCHLQAPRVEVDHPIAGTDLVARDPYGGLLTRNRLFFDFSVRGSAAALAGVAKVQWALDGTVVREDPTAPFEWKGVSGSSKRMPVGDHTITVTVTPKAGAPASTQFALTATDCQNATFYPEIPQKRGAASLDFGSAFEADGEPLDAVSANAAKNVVAAIPSALRGRAIGTLEVGKKTYTLKGARTALSRGKLKVSLVPGAKTFLKVSGLPAGTQTVHVAFKPGILRLRSAKLPFLVKGTLTAGSRHVSLSAGGVYA